MSRSEIEKADNASSIRTCKNLALSSILIPHCWSLTFISYLDKCQEKLRTEAAEASTGTGSAGPTRHPTEEMDVDSNSNQPSGVGGAGAGGGGGGGGDGEGGKDGKHGKHHGQHPPAKQYQLTDTMKSMV